MLTMVICAYELVRRKVFELFYYVHHLAYVAFFFAALHSAAVGGHLMEVCSCLCLLSMFVLVVRRCWCAAVFLRPRPAHLPVR